MAGETQHHRVNYFAHPTAADRYARGRPYFHPQIIERIKAFLKLDAPLPLALDAACGTGNSALALTDIASSVIAVDISPAMLARAPAHPRIRYVEAPAEQLPVEDNSVDLITVSLAFHWLDRARFLAEARRVLRPTGTLVIYNRGFRARMKENPAFLDWFNALYLARYPTPPRDDRPFAGEDAQSHQFNFAARDRYSEEVPYTPEELVRDLITHSNVIACVEEGRESVADVSAWLLEAVRPLFPGPNATFLFGGEIWYLQPSVPVRSPSRE
jgi:SAM-dependent methyltransferase